VQPVAHVFCLAGTTRQGYQVPQTGPAIFLGIDVAKSKLEVAPLRKHMSVGYAGHERRTPGTNDFLSAIARWA
jgi:hypothetical protein